MTTETIGAAGLVRGRLHVASPIHYNAGAGNRLEVPAKHRGQTRQSIGGTRRRGLSPPPDQI